MKNCVNHPMKTAISVCHSCGEDFCEWCLDEGTEYYYCKKPECQMLLKKETNPELLEGAIICPNCNTELDLSSDERLSGKFHCPECEAFVDKNFDPPKIILKSNYVELLSTLNQGDIAMLKSLLDDGEIDYYVSGENFLSIRPLLEPAKIYVNETQTEQVKELLKGFDLHIWGVSTSH